MEDAKASSGESFTTIAYLGVGTTEVAAILATDTSLSGEVGTRIVASKSRSDRTSSFSAIRSGANVINTSTGDLLESSGWLSALTSGDLHIAISHTGLLQQTSFDLEFVLDRTPRRV